MRGKLTDLYRKLAAQGGNFHGHNILQYEADLKDLIQRTGATSLLDYGCGRGDPWKEGLAKRLGISSVALYDPAFPEHSHLPPIPLTYDGVVCSDVLEHVPEDEVPFVLAQAMGYATKFFWASICCRPAKKKFPDGTNMHVTLRGMEWWWQAVEVAAALTDRPADFVLALVETP